MGVARESRRSPGGSLTPARRFRSLFLLSAALLRAEQDLTHQPKQQPPENGRSPAAVAFLNTSPVQRARRGSAA